jgi:hypothetical protein
VLLVHRRDDGEGEEGEPDEQDDSALAAASHSWSLGATDWRMPAMYSCSS